MSDKVRKESKLSRLLRMTVFIDKSLEPLFTLRFTPVALVIGIGAFAILLIAGVTVLIAFTGLREYIPGYPTGEERLMIMQNLQRADSLSNEVALRDNMLHNLRAVLGGDDKVLLRGAASDTSAAHTASLTQESLAQLNKDKSSEENSFISGVESAERFDVDESTDPNDNALDKSLEATFFFTPIRGIVTDGFGVRNGHLGVDVSAKEGTPVMSTLAGTVVFSEWTVQTGYVVMIQHDNQLVSVYKHNARILKFAGSRVQAGEAVALTGNSGELTSGPHLHFELWYQGAPLNPENYINFDHGKDAVGE